MTLTSPAPSLLKPTPHPLEPWPITPEMIAAADEAELAAIVEQFSAREERIALAEEDTGDPFYHGYEPDHWAEADADFKAAIASTTTKTGGQYISGGRRAGKSERAARRVLQAALRLPNGIIWCLQGNEKTSVAQQQRLIWKYLPNSIKAINGKRTGTGHAKVNYGDDKGFQSSAGPLLVLPNRTQIWFLTYKMEVKDYQGWKLGAPLTDDLRWEIQKTPWLFNLGAWADEDMPITWLETIGSRCATNSAQWLWTFTTLEGITPTVKELLTGARTVEHRRAAALPAGMRYWPDCPPGRVPYKQRVLRSGVSVMYFHTDLNPFPPNYENMLALVKGRPSGVILLELYGVGTDTRHKAFTKFGAWNIVRPQELPAEVTNYFFTDPAGARPWASFWVRVTPGRPRKFYIYREWPPVAQFGPWAIPSADPRRPGGDRGQGQRPIGYGWANYKLAWWAAETVRPPRALLEHLAAAGEAVDWERVREMAGELADPHAAQVLLQALRRGESIHGGVRERIAARYIDPRAGKDSRASDRGGTCAIDELARTQRDAQSGAELAGPMVFIPAVGKQELTGVQAVNDLLDWDMDHPDGLMPLLNEPHLYVSSECPNTIWALENYVCNDGERVLEGGCDDFADLLRYMALADLRHLNRERRVKTETWGY